MASSVATFPPSRARSSPNFAREADQSWSDGGDFFLFFFSPPNAATNPPIPRPARKFGLSVHLYFNRSLSLPSKPERMDEYWGPEAERESERVVPDGNKRPYDVKLPPPPQKQKPAPGVRVRVLAREVVNAFKSAYETDAMGDDEYHPLSHRGSNLGSGGGIGYPVFDALDTMLLMGPALDAEYKRAHMDRMLPIFESKSGLPASYVNLGGKSASPGGRVSISEVRTLQLGFRYLAEITGRTTFCHKAEKIMQVVNKVRIPNGLAPIDMNGDGTFARSGIRLGRNGDSYYEYLLKQYIQTMYADAMRGVHDNLVFKTPMDELT
ncbi:glycoside hydrolase [Mycena olivaceomarginata]|nr:glycoside hydrolase [Mycena olivaceomarginata]